jgi:hypothetical protein
MNRRRETVAPEGSGAAVSQWAVLRGYLDEESGPGE